MNFFFKFGKKYYYKGRYFIRKSSSKFQLKITHKCARSMVYFENNLKVNIVDNSTQDLLIDVLFSRLYDKYLTRDFKKFSFSFRFYRSTKIFSKLTKF